MKKIIITRKIQLNVDLESKSDEMKYAYEKLYAIQRYTYRCANLIATHNYIQDQIKDLIYLTDETKVKLANIEKDEAGILNTSKLNSVYRILSDKFKGKIPATILTALNSVITTTYNSEKKEYFTGQRALRNYKNNIPIPFQKTSIRNLRLDISTNNYHFELFGIPFKTYLGIDRSNNRSIIERILSEEYEMGDSSIQIKNNKLFLLMVVKFEKYNVKVDPKKIITAELSWDHPIIVKYKKKEFTIGKKEEFIHRRLQIQNALQRAQIAARYNQGGKGRRKKLKNIDFYKEKESNYVKTKLHQYSHNLIHVALQQNAGKIKLINIPDTDQLREDEPFLLRNWSYHGLIELIKYKANKFGIEIVQDK